MVEGRFGDSILRCVRKPKRTALNILAFFWILVVHLVSVANIGYCEEISISFPDRMSMVHCYGPFIRITLGAGDVHIYDTAGVQLYRYELKLENGDYCKIIPSDSLLVVVRSQGDDGSHSLSDWIEDMFVGGSLVELIDMKSGGTIFSHRFAGDPGYVAYASGAGLLAVSVLEESERRVVLLNVGSGEVLSEVDGGLSIRDVLLEDSTLYVVGAKSIRRYVVRDDGKLARAGTDLFECRFSIYLTRSYYDRERRRLAIYNDCVDSVIGPISLIKVGSVAQGIKDLIPGQIASGWSWHYRHKTRELFVNHIGEMLYVANLMTNVIDSCSTQQLRSTGPVGDIIPLESSRCIVLPCVRGEPCKRLRLVDSDDLLSPVR